MYLIFDTETADKPPDKKTRNATHERDFSIWPRLVQLAFVIYDKERKIIKEYDQIIKPHGKFIIEKGAEEVHGISTERAEAEGIDAEIPIREFYKAMSNVKYVVCHNIDFDYNVMLAEHYKNQIKVKPNNNERIKVCTMMDSLFYCDLPPTWYKPHEPKWPKLEELHEKLFGYVFKGAHNAMIDVRVTAQCFWELIDRKVINLNDDNVLRKDFIYNQYIDYPDIESEPDLYMDTN
jgi:DNA polymerase III epsilon subunit-like protein